jgi:uncharacterized membrane protein YoaK (UPF0700 family)
VALFFVSSMTLTAGFVDAIGYSELGNLYLSFMSGNTTHMGMVIASRQFGAAAQVAGVIALFVFGAALGTLVGGEDQRLRMPRIFALETVMFGVAAVCYQVGLGPLAVMTLAVAMGMQNLLHRNLWAADVGKGFVTGALVSAGQCFARAIREPGMLRTGFVLVASWLIFVGGVVLGAWLLTRIGLGDALLVGAALLAALTAAAFVAARQGRGANTVSHGQAPEAVPSSDRHKL